MTTTTITAANKFKAEAEAENALLADELNQVAEDIFGKALPYMINNHGSVVDVIITFVTTIIDNNLANAEEGEYSDYEFCLMARALINAKHRNACGALRSLIGGLKEEMSKDVMINVQRSVRRGEKVIETANMIPGLARALVPFADAEFVPAADEYAAKLKAAYATL